MSFLKNIRTAEQIEDERIESLSCAAKQKRNKLLAETDFLVMPDYPKRPLGIEEYRRALRDLTEQEGFPEIIEWPVLPQENNQ